MAHDPLASAYATLGLPRDAPFDSVRHQYKALVRKWHPDHFTGDPNAVAEATLMLKAVNHAYSTIQNYSSDDSTQEPDSESQAQRNHPLDGKLTQAQIDNVVAAILDSESPRTILFTETAVGWRSRKASSLVALAYLAIGLAVGQTITVLTYCLPCLLIIWFPDVLGDRVGWQFTKPSPATLVWFLGWVLLLLPVLAFAIMWPMMPT